MRDAPNDEPSVTYFTLCIDGIPEAQRRAEIDAAVHRRGGQTTWRTHPSIGRAYALLALPDGDPPGAIAVGPGEVLHDTTVIALAVSPTVPQALPRLQEAFDGPGRPAGILACFLREDRLVIEWDPALSNVELVRRLVDVELQRFRAGRLIEVLAPLPKACIMTIAAEGLQAPQIEPGRVLELLIEDA